MMRGIFMHKARSYRSVLFCSLALCAALALACDDKNEIDKDGDSAQALAGSTAVKIRIFDDNCNESAFIRKYVGRDVMAHFRIAGATTATHAIGLVGSTASTVLDFNSLVLRNPAVGTYTFRVVVRDKKQCAADGVAADQCGILSGVVADERSFDVSSDVNFIVADPNVGGVEDEGGFLKNALDGLAPNILENMKKKGGILGGLAGAAGNAISGKQEEADLSPTDPNIGRCVSGVPADIP